jgi:nucleoside-diphosphate-sugar epimerase
LTTHLVTGATGFVGGALVLELLDRTSDRIIALARPGPSPGEDAHSRLIASLRHAATAYGRDPDDLDLGRVRGVAGDVTAPACGVDGIRADVVWHSAASLRYEDRYADEILATNVDGTRNVVEMARRAGATVLNQISTAYVAGRRDGHLAEIPQDDAPSQNHYERSKVAAEALARAADGLQVRVLRPSIVVGHSRTRAATTFSGLYGFTRQMIQYRGVLERMQAGMYKTRRVRMRVSEHAPINLVPVDAVAAQAAHIGLQGDARGVYHLTQEDVPLVGASIRAIAALVGFAEPEFVGPEDELDWLDEQFDKRLDFYGAYVRGHRVFDRTRARDALAGAERAERALPSVEDLAGWYIDRLEAERRAVPVAR